jgi:hypothetical protein
MAFHMSEKISSIMQLLGGNPRVARISISRGNWIQEDPSLDPTGLKL